jgi:O-antigen/teichoic acid export membrane protein
MYRKLLISIDYPAAIAWGWIGAFFLNIALNVVLIQRFGINGAAAASSLTYFAVASVTIFLLSKFSQESKDGVWI